MKLWKIKIFFFAKFLFLGMTKELIFKFREFLLYNIETLISHCVYYCATFIVSHHIATENFHNPCILLQCTTLKSFVKILSDSSGGHNRWLTVVADSHWQVLSLSLSGGAATCKLQRLWNLSYECPSNTSYFGTFISLSSLPTNYTLNSP